MKPITVLALVAVSAACVIARADEWEPPGVSETFSDDKTHVFVVTPHEKLGGFPGHCKGELFKIEGGKRTSVWSRHLINDVAPVSVRVANSGQVVTMDEWHRVGKLPIVIYSTAGRLVAVHGIDALLSKEERSKVLRTVSSFWWNRDAVSFIGPKDEHFYLCFPWGRILILELKIGEIMDQAWYAERKDWKKKEAEWHALNDYGRTRASREAVAMLASESAVERRTGAVLCGTYKVKDAIPRLKSLLLDPDYNISIKGGEGEKKDYFVRKAAAESLKTLGEGVDGVILEEPRSIFQGPQGPNSK